MALTLGDLYDPGSPDVDLGYTRHWLMRFFLTWIHILQCHFYLAHHLHVEH